MKNKTPVIILPILLLFLVIPSIGQTGSHAPSKATLSRIDLVRLNRYDDFLKREINEGRIPWRTMVLQRIPGCPVPAYRTFFRDDHCRILKTKDIRPLGNYRYRIQHNHGKQGQMDARAQSGQTRESDKFRDPIAY